MTIMTLISNSLPPLPLLELDELETGYPKITLSYLLDIAGIIRHKVAKISTDPGPYNEVFRKNLSKVQQRTSQIDTSHELSWLALIGRLGKIRHLKIFDNPNARPLKYSDLIKAGQVSIVDLSDTDAVTVRNLVIADILRGVQQAQEQQVAEAVGAGCKPTPVVVIVPVNHHKFTPVVNTSQIRESRTDLQTCMTHTAFQ